MRIESSTESEAEREHEEDENDYEEDYERPPSSPAHVKIIKASARFVEEADGPEEQAQAQRERGGGGVQLIQKRAAAGVPNQRYDSYQPGSG